MSTNSKGLRKLSAFLSVLMVLTMMASLTAFAAGLAMNVSVSKLGTAPNDTNKTVSQANQNAVNVTKNDNTYTVTGNLADLNSFASTNTAQGEHKWVGLVVDVDTGDDSIIGVSCNGTVLAQADVDDATSVGVGAGKFVLWIKADQVVSADKTFTLSKTGMTSTTITIKFKDTTPAVSKLATVNQSDANKVVSQANQDAVTVSQTGNTVTVSGKLANLNSFASTASGMGTHKWVGLVVDTKVADITAVKYNGAFLISADVTDAASVGVSEGSFVLWIKADEVATTPKTFTLWRVDKLDSIITIQFTETTSAPASSDKDETDIWSGSGTGSDKSSSSSSSTPSTVSTTTSAAGSSTAASSSSEVAPAAIAQQVAAAVQAATAKNPAEVSVQNAASISNEALKTMVQSASGKAVTLLADTMTADGSAVQCRMYIDPSKLTGLTADLKLGMSTNPDKTQPTASLFEKSFNNNIAVIHCEQQGSFGAKLEIAAKVDLSKLNAKTLVFYSYDKATNTYTTIKDAKSYIDANGYLHMSTSLAGDIIITDKALTNK